MMNASKLRLLGGVALAFVSATVIAFGQVTKPVTQHPLRPTPLATAAPAATATPGVLAPFNPISKLMPRAGDRVPLSLLPPLPPRTAFNTISRRGDVKRMAADGSTIGITTGGGCSGTTGTVGAFYNTGCTINWGGTSLPSSGHTWHDYYIAPGSSTAVSASGNYTGTNNAYNDTTTLSTAGIYVLATEDVTTGLWETVVYVNVTSTGTVKVYQDSNHTLETYQYDANSSAFAYIQATNVPAGDKFTVYVEYTSKNPTCIYSSPAQGSYPANSLCNPTALTGTLNSSGVVNVTWPITTSLNPGTYTVVVYDNSLNQRLAEAQVALIGSVGIALQTLPDGTNANPSPRPLPAAAQQTAIAWNDNNDQSASGVLVTTQASFPSHSYTWTLHAPDGSVAYRSTGTASGVLSKVMPFTNNIYSPGNYPSKVFTATLYDNTTGVVQSSEAFTVLGYYAQTLFDVSGVYQSSLPMTGGSSATAGLKFINQSDTQYGSGNGDSISKIQFTTGVSYTPTSTSSNFGMTSRLNGFTQAQCFPSCSSTANDSAGNTWNVVDACSASATGPNEECVLTLTPQSSTVSLAVGASIEVTNMTFSNASGNTCTSQPQGACLGETSIFPTHGLSWSINCSSGSLASGCVQETSASQAVYFAAGNQTHSGTASIVLVGECTGPPGGTVTCNYNNAEAHFYPVRETQGVYQRTTPYSLTTNYWDLYRVTVNNTSSSGSITQVALGMPGAFGSMNTLQNIETNPNGSFVTNWGNVGTCPTSSGLNQSIYVCWTGQGSHKVATGGSDTIEFLINPTVASFGYSDASLYSVAAYSFALTPTGNLTVYAAQPSTNIDTQSLAVYSLNANLMNAYFNPSQVGQNTASAPVSIVYTNTSTSQDPFPDYIDAIEMSFSNAFSINTISTSGATGWAQQGAAWASGATTNYMFGLCAAQNTNGSATPPPTTPLSAVPNAVPTCTAALEQADSLAPGASVTLNFNLQNINTNSSIPFNLYVHGANGGGWAGPITATLTATPVAASAGFSKINGTAVVSNSEPSVSQDTGNVFQYSIKNTSAATSITEEKITIPATDISGLTATQLGTTAWSVSSPSVVSGCVGTPSISLTQVSGTTNGLIDVTGCTLAAGSTIVIQFTASNPSVQNDEWQFPTVVNPGTVTAGEAWQNDTRVKVLDTYGLAVVVNPGDPGPGGSYPNVSCTTCAFSGTTIDFGNPASNSQTQYTDVSRVSVTAVSSAHTNWVVCMEGNQNPASTYAGESYELQSSTDSAASTPTSQGTAYFNTSFLDVPYTGEAATNQFKIMTGPFTTTSHNPYDAIQSFRLSIGSSDPLSPHLVTLTYTLLLDTTTCPSA